MAAWLSCPQPRPTQHFRGSKNDTWLPIFNPNIAVYYLVDLGYVTKITAPPFSHLSGGEIMRMSQRCWEDSIRKYMTSH